VMFLLWHVASNRNTEPHKALNNGTKNLKGKPSFWRLAGLPENITENELRIKLNESSYDELNHSNSSQNEKHKFVLIPQPQSGCIAIVTSIQTPRIFGIEPDSNFIGITPLYAPVNAIVE